MNMSRGGGGGGEKAREDKRLESAGGWGEQMRSFYSRDEPHFQADISTTGPCLCCYRVQVDKDVKNIQQRVQFKGLFKCQDPTWGVFTPLRQDCVAGKFHSCNYFLLHLNSQQVNYKLAQCCEVPC